jgi:hypothetical protein
MSIGGLDQWHTLPTLRKPALGRGLGAMAPIAA